jgi:SpoVK/Ycf46/Vps4 family AAA+-type ATPase
MIDPGKFRIPAVVFGGALAVTRRLVEGDVEIDEETRQRVQRARAWLERASDVTEGFSVEDPGSWAKTAGRVMDEAFDTHGVPEDAAGWRKMFGFTRKVAAPGVLARRVRACEKVTVERVYERDGEVIEVLTTPDGIEVALVMAQKSQLIPKGMYFRRDADAKTVRQELAAAFWSGVSAFRAETTNSNMAFREVSFEDYEFIGEKRELIDQWRAFLEAGESRNVLLQGQPGTGKTTLCAHAARELSERTLVLAGRVLDAMEPAEWRKTMAALAPEVVIIDDVDRTSEGDVHAAGGRHLRVMTEMREQVPLLLMTSNDHSQLPAAVRRPGRIDRIVSFDRPTREVRRRAVRELADRQSLEVPEEHLGWLVDLLNEHGGAHVEEALVRASVLGWESVRASGEGFRKHSTYEDCRDWLQARNFERISLACDALPGELFECGEAEICFRGERANVERVRLGSGLQMCRTTEDEAFRGAGKVWIDRGESVEDSRMRFLKAAADLFWQGRHEVEVTALDQELYFEASEFETEDYVGPRAEYIERWGDYMAAGRRRCVLLQGPPGTGKSTLCRHAARELSERTLYVDNDVLRTMYSGEWTELLMGTRPELIVVDDVDRLGRQELDSKLRLIEEGVCSVPLMLLTCNDPDQLPEAMKRPGRIDQIVSFEAPDETKRKKLIVALSEREGVEVPDEWLHVLDEVFREQSPAHVREMLRRADVLGWDALGGMEGDETFVGSRQVGESVGR